MLPAPHRLREPGAFRSVPRRGRRAGTSTLVVHLATDPAGPGEVARVGFAVSKAVGGSVVRNRVKRRLRHLMRDRLDRLPRDGVVVVRALPAAARASSSQLGLDLDRALSRTAG